MAANKKGVVYRLTMAGGFGLIAYQMFGEVFYYKYMRQDRNEEIQQEKDDERKINRFEQEAPEEKGTEEEELNKKMLNDVKSA